MIINLYHQILSNLEKSLSLMNNMKDKTILLALTLCLFFSCRHKNERAMPPTRVLTIADLKFPIVENERTALGYIILPRPQNEVIKHNRIKGRAPIPQLMPMNCYPQETIEFYNEIGRQSLHISFDSFFRKFRARTDITYDTNGRESESINYSQFSIHLQYRFDSLGYLVREYGGSCIPHDWRYNYVFSAVNRKLYRYKYDQYSWHPLDTNMAIPFDQFQIMLYSEPEIFEFDTAGYLTEITTTAGYPNWMEEYYHRNHWQFLYDEKHYLRSVIEHNNWGTRSKEYNDMYPENSSERLPDHSVSDYFYTGNHLDSIVTNMYYYCDFRINRTLQVYFDERGLPVKQIHNYYSEKTGSKAILYKYEYYK